jgi:hypothetical protein
MRVAADAHGRFWQVAPILPAVFNAALESAAVQCFGFYVASLTASIFEEKFPGL